MTEDLKPAKTVDTSGTCCPVPIVETNRAVKTIQAGEILQVICTDIGARMDIPAWCRRTSNTLVRTEDDGTIIRFFIRRRE